MSLDVYGLASFLAERHITLKQPWLQAVLGFFQISNRASTELYSFVYYQWLHQDLKLTTELASSRNAQSTQPKNPKVCIFQIISIVDVSATVYNPNTPDLVSTMTINPLFEDLAKTPRRRVFAMELSDGKNCIKAIEYETINSLTGQRPGCKVSVHGIVKVKVNMLLLNSQNCQVLGGYVEHFVDLNVNARTRQKRSSEAAQNDLKTPPNTAKRPALEPSMRLTNLDSSIRLFPSTQAVKPQAVKSQPRVKGNLKVIAGVNKTLRLPDTQVVLIGRHKHLKSLKFDSTLAGKLNGVDAGVFNAAIKKLQPDSSVPLYLDLAKLIAVKDDVSRHNAPSNSVEIFKELSDLKIVPTVTNLSIVVYAEWEHVFASVVAIVRSFPVFQRKTKKDELKSISVEIVVIGAKKLGEKDLKFLQALCDSMRTCARQVDTPFNEFNSEDFATDAIRLVDELKTGITKTIIKGEELLKQGFGGIYSIGKTARNPPIFICFSHKPKGSKEIYALVGAGIIYDTGGLSLKSSMSMRNTKVDITGAAGLLGAFCTLVKSGFKEELHCVFCIAENHVCPDATKPDTVIKMLSGKFVEVNSSNAEERLALADGIFYAKNTLKAKTIIDMATLTDTQTTALGKLHSTVLCNNENSETQIVKAGRKSGDLVHPLPYSPELHVEGSKSTIADMKSSIDNSREGLLIADAGLFVFSHVDFDSKIKLIHIDMASSSLANERSIAFGVPLISALLSKHIDVDIAK